jgi:hypothetical protein
VTARARVAVERVLGHATAGPDLLLAHERSVLFECRSPKGGLPLGSLERARDGSLEVRGRSDGFHRTDTHDIGWLISGELELELDDGQISWLEPGDLIVRKGTRHKWHNRTDEPAVEGFVTLGANRPEEGTEPS